MIKPPVTFKIYDPDRFAFAVFYDADDVEIKPQQIVDTLHRDADWVAVSERLPQEEGWYWVTTTKSGNAMVCQAHYLNGEFLERCVVAWMPIDEPKPSAVDVISHEWNTPEEDEAWANL